MRCSVKGCQGEYVQRKIVYAVKVEGRIVVVDGVPAEVCDVCGDTLLSEETVRQLEKMLKSLPTTSESVPLYHYGTA